MLDRPTGRRRQGAVLLLLLVLLGGVVAAGVPASAATASDTTSPDTASSDDAPPADDRWIVGGTPAAPGEFPSQAALVVRGQSASAGQFCGGTVVDRSWVLTAGHCVTDRGRVVSASSIDILVGTTSLTSGGTRIRVVEVRRHPGYNDSTLRNDIALLRLDKPVPANIPIQALAGSGTDPAAGTDVVTIGWGDLGNGYYPNDLQKVTLDMRSPAGCRVNAGADFDANTMICAWRAAKSACFGDSGGPLYERRNDTWVQVGVVSWGYECGSTDSVFARVSVFSTWIKWQVRYGAQPDATSFVRRQYLDLFGRQPTATELRNGVNALQGGQGTVAYVDGLLRSAAFDSRTGAVIRLYRAIFLRRPESGGLMFWKGEVERGVGIKRVADLMVRAPEFTTLYGSLDNGEFVDLVYQNVLSRTPSAPDRAYWVAELQSGRRSRGQVMIGFSESPEYKGITRPEVAVIGPFSALVRRAPTAAEMTTHVGSPSADLTRFLLTSTAYLQRF